MKAGSLKPSVFVQLNTCSIERKVATYLQFVAITIIVIIITR